MTPYIFSSELVKLCADLPRNSTRLLTGGTRLRGSPQTARGSTFARGSRGSHEKENRMYRQKGLSNDSMQRTAPHADAEAGL